MSDPQNPGLGELGQLGQIAQRVQALSDAVAEPRLRPYQGAPLPVGAASNGRPIPSYESYEEFRVTPVTPTPAPKAAASNPNTASPNLSSPSLASPSAGTPGVSSNSNPSPFSFSPSFSSGQAAPHQVEAHAAWEELTPPRDTSPLPPQQPAAPAPQAASASPAADPNDPNAPRTGLQKAIQAVRTALPLVQKLLPLLDGNFATVIGALVAPPPHHPPPPPPHPPVDLDPLERGLAEVRTSNRELRGQVQEQVTTLKRVEDQLERVREATDRNTLEQQELVEDLRSMGNRMITFVILGLVLLLGSIGLNVFFLVQLQHILH